MRLPILRLSYLLLAGSTLSLLAFEAPRAGVLTSSPAKGKVGKAPPNKSGSTVRSRRGVVPFVFIGGGYRGGK